MVNNTSFSTQCYYSYHSLTVNRLDVHCTVNAVQYIQRYYTLYSVHYSPYSVIDIPELANKTGIFATYNIKQRFTLTIGRLNLPRVAFCRLIHARLCAHVRMRLHETWHTPTHSPVHMANACILAYLVCTYIKTRRMSYLYIYFYDKLPFYTLDSIICMFRKVTQHCNDVIDYIHLILWCLIHFIST